MDEDDPEVCGILSPDLLTLSSKSLAQFLQTQQFTPSQCKVLEGSLFCCAMLLVHNCNHLLLSPVSMDFGNCLTIFGKLFLLCFIEKCLTLGTLDSFVQENCYSSSLIYFMNWPYSCFIINRCLEIKSPFFLFQKATMWMARCF